MESVHECLLTQNVRMPIWFIIITSLAQCVQYADEKNF